MPQSQSKAKIKIIIMLHIIFTAVKCDFLAVCCPAIMVPLDIIHVVDMIRASSPTLVTLVPALVVVVTSDRQHINQIQASVRPGVPQPCYYFCLISLALY